MKIIETALPGVVIIEPAVFHDHRGFFTESYNQEKIESNLLHYEFVQDNQSMSKEAGTIRGLHYQIQPKAQSKLVRVTRGSIYDVVVDIRPGSSTFGKWLGVILSAENMRQLLVPKGFAHGFCTLVSDTHVLYKVDEYYSKEHDRGIAWNDPDLAIDWPFSKPVLSEKDDRHPDLLNVKEVSAS